MKALFVDFDDSFSYNVIQELEELGIKVQVINWKDLELTPQTDLLIFGPGPGHPDEYQRLFPLLQEWLSKKKPFFGICLGHQIFWTLRGEKVIRSKEPLHGQKVRLHLSPFWKEWLKLDEDPWVQRYNSLCILGTAQIQNPDVLSFIQDDEILLTKGENVITYQFHPESVGTTFRAAFFAPLLEHFV
jgi:anthranilate/para-aminobenzoate synthase component II